MTYFLVPTSIVSVLDGVHITVAVVSERVCDSSRSPLSVYSESRPVIPPQSAQTR